MFVLFININNTMDIISRFVEQFIEIFEYKLNS